MTPLPPTLLHFRLLDKLGEGGMGEVWRARDTTLDREVALKFLPAGFDSDPERLARFEREAKVLASLNHPHIAAIHGLHEAEGRRFLSMELVPGEDLAERLKRGALAPAEALVVGAKIAEALEYAHERGIVHRDLKPANVKLTPDGGVKVLDFGLAKAVTGDPGTTGPTSTPTILPTLTSAGTAAGLILGTAAYMSPEQARGRAVDRRADIWSFGCVLYELLTARRAFDGETVTDVLAAVVTRDPDWSALPAGTPPAVRRLLARCLDKDPRTRLRDVGEARIVLASPGVEDGGPAAVAAPARPSRIWIGAAAAALAAGLAIGRFALAPKAVPPPPYEFEITIPGQQIDTAGFALSPDGRRLVAVTRDAAGKHQLSLRDMNSVDARILPGTQGASFPFWSPDGREIGFFADDRLLRIALDGAAPRIVGPVPGPAGASWGADDVILVGNTSGPIRKVQASGGKPPEPITKLEPGVETTHVWPVFLPDGRRFLFLADASSDDGHRIYLADLGGAPARILRKGIRSQPVVDPSGRLLLGQQGQLVAFPLDFARGTLGETATLITSQVYPLGNIHAAPFSAAADGTLAFQTGSPETEIAFADRTGTVTRTLGATERFGNPVISPDGKRVAFEIFADGAERLVWEQDIERGVRTAISFRGAMADSAVWSPDGGSLYFDSNRGGQWEAYRKTVDGGEPEKLGAPPGEDLAVLDISPDGRWLLASNEAGDMKYDLYVRELGASKGEWSAWASGPFVEDRGVFSRDSRWIAYTTDASGRTEVYIAPREGGPKVRNWQISAEGGTDPHFSRDGRTLYYRSPSSECMAVDVDLSGGTVRAGTPRSLFKMPAVDLPYVRNLIDVLPDGSGFVLLRPAHEGRSAVRIRTGSR